MIINILILLLLLLYMYWVSTGRVQIYYWPGMIYLPSLQFIVSSIGWISNAVFSVNEYIIHY